MHTLNRATIRSRCIASPGSLVIRGSSSSVVVKRVEQDVYVRTSYNPVTVEHVAGKLDIDGSSCSVVVRQISGDTKVVNSYNPVTAEDIAGNLDIRGSSSSVTVERIEQNATIRTSYNPIVAEEIGGDLRIDGNSCSVLVEGIEGDATIANSHNYVVVKGSAGALAINGHNSPIEVSNVAALPATGRVELFTTGKPVELHIPADADVEARLQTKRGKIRSDFPLVAEEEGRNRRNRSSRIGQCRYAGTRANGRRHQD